MIKSDVIERSLKVTSWEKGSAESAGPFWLHTLFLFVFFQLTPKGTPVDSQFPCSFTLVPVAFLECLLDPNVFRILFGFRG